MGCLTKRASIGKHWARSASLCSGVLEPLGKGASGVLIENSELGGISLRFQVFFEGRLLDPYAAFIGSRHVQSLQQYHVRFRDFASPSRGSRSLGLQVLLAPPAGLSIRNYAGESLYATCYLYCTKRSAPIDHLDRGL